MRWRITHLGIAPTSLTVVFPGVLVGACAIRCLIWLRRRDRVVEPKAAARTLRATVVLGGVLGFAFLAWALSLFPYGDTSRHGHIMFFVGITVVSCIFCVMHVRPAALILTGSVIVPFVVFLLASGDVVHIAIGLNLFLVTVAMIYILIICSGQFAAMVNGQVETRRLSNENFRLANVDSLTDLPNRRQFFHRLSDLAEQAKTANRRFVVGVLDLDGFKAVNDLYGHGVGDRVLMETGQRLLAFSDDTQFIARLGGDEFGIIVDADLDPEAVLAVGAKVCSAFDAPFSVAGIVAKIGGSVGFALAPDAGTTAELLYERADYALYHAKARYRGQPVIFSREHEVEIRRLSTIEHTLRRIDLDAELSLHFQPIVNVGTARLVGFEALARWHNPELGTVPPDVFISVAERTELIGTITQVLLRKALAAARCWPEEISLSFNLSMRDLISQVTILQTVALIESSGIDPRRIIMEVTETALMQDYEQVQEFAQDFAIDGIEGGARRLRIRASQPELCPSIVAGQDQDRPGLHSQYRDAGKRPQHRQDGDRPVPQPEIRLRGRRCGNGGAGRDHQPSRLLDDAGIFLRQADAAKRGKHLYRQLPHAGSSANGRRGRVSFDQR